MGERPERWSSTMSGQRLYNDNYKFQLTIPPSSSLAWSRFRWAITRSFDGNSRLQPVDTLSPVPFQPYNSPSSVHIKIFVLDERAYHVPQEKFNPIFIFLHLLFGISDPGDAGFELLGRRRLCFTFRTRHFHEKSPTDRLVRPALP